MACGGCGKRRTVTYKFKCLGCGEEFTITAGLLYQKNGVWMSRATRNALRHDKCGSTNIKRL